LDNDSVLERPLDAGFGQDLTTEACTQSGYIHPAPYVRHPRRRGHRSLAVEMPTELRHNLNEHPELSHNTTGTTESFDTTRACADCNKLDAITAATSKSPQGSTDVTDGQVDTGRPLSIAHAAARSDVYQPHNDRESRQSQATDNATDNLLQQLRARSHPHAPADFVTLQRQSADLLPIFQWLEDGILPTDKKLAATMCCIDYIRRLSVMCIA